jgi:phosphate transport system ATP-binding protein
MVTDSGVSGVHAKGVQAYYGSFHALKSIEFHADAHAVTALIGPSGCGKSTFLRCINRMNDLIDGFRQEGVITVNGQDILDKALEPERLRRRVGMVFQKPNPFPKTIYENIAFGMKLGGAPKAEIDAMVEKSLRGAALWEEVKDKLQKNALALSGGQQQRLCIARTLAIEPEVILMDEPTSALDPISTGKVEELVNELKKEYTILIVTHNMQQARRIADSTAFFYLG